MKPKPQPKMKIFKAIKEYLVLLGIKPNELPLFNWKITMGFLMFGLGILLNVILIFSLENLTLMDYMNVFNIISSLVLVTICLVAFVLQQTKLFEFIGNIENLINESNSI